MKKIISVLLAVFLLVSVLPLAVSAEEGEFKTVLINENGDYLLNENDYDAVDIDGVTGTVTLADAGVFSAGRSAIKVMNNSDVTFVLEGFSTVEGDTNAYSCGIEVEYGSKVTFEGSGTLNVTGGLRGAAIGSYGTDRNIPAEERVKVGEITINSGFINAFAGRRGSGIGSGYHVDANLITINGGVIHAYGNECGAGIGTGYGTSGGAIGVAAVGDYSAGRIVINGGEVYAATAWNQGFDYSDLAALNANDPGTFAAGIGGGYGSSAPDIEINGGKVVAIGSCGGAGIGGGRGSSKAAKYNQDTYTVNVKISGNADVTAISANSRSNEYNSGGAAIGSGRGSHTGGTIEITGNAKVTAISATQAPAIGASKQISPVDGAIPVAESIVIGDDVDLYAVSAGDYAVDKDASTLSVNDEYFGSSDRWFFKENAVAISDIANVKAESTKGDMMYTAPAGAVSLWARIKAAAPDTPDTPDKPEEKEEKGNLRIDVPLKMAVVFDDGTVYYGGEMKDVVVGKEYTFQMCAVNWDNGTFDDNGNGIRGTVVYRMEVVHQNDFNKLAEAAKGDPERYTVKGIDIIDNVEKKIIINIDAKDTHLETDVNNFFMAYRFHFKGEDYDKQTGIAQVINTPLESLSVNLPLGSTITCNAYHSYEKVDSADVFIENNSGEGVYDDVYLTSVNDYTWE